jgi:membrane-associated phospholipid phosphatase
MRRFRRVFLVLVALGAPGAIEAQSIPKAFVSDLKHGVLDMFAVWTSPFRGDARDYLSAGIIAGGFGLAVLADEPIQEWLRTHQHVGILEPVAPFRDGHPSKLRNAGSAPWVAKGGLAIWTVGLISGQSGIRDAGMGCLASTEANSIPRGQIVYRLVSRERPTVEEVVGTDTILRPGDPHKVRFPGTDSWFDNSFFGGHGANILSCVSFLNHRFHLGLVEPALWLVGAAVTVGRMADERHWFSDAAAGAVFGIAIGKYVAQRSLQRRDKRDAARAGTDTSSSAQSGKWTDNLYLSKRGNSVVFGFTAKN